MLYTYSYMWQDVLNIILGLGLLAIAFISSWSGLLNPVLFWIFAGIGALVAILAFWGLIDEIAYESGKGSGSGM